MERKTDMEEEKQTLNGLITGEQIAEIKKSVTNTNSMMFSYVELVRKSNHGQSDCVQRTRQSVWIDSRAFRIHRWNTTKTVDIDQRF